MCAQTFQEKEFSPSVNSPVKVEQESTEVAARKAPEGEHAEREEQKPSASRKEEKEEATEMDVEEGKEKSEEKPSVKVEEEEEEVGQAPSPRITRARRREVSQTPEVVKPHCLTTVNMLSFSLPLASC